MQHLFLGLKNVARQLGWMCLMCLGVCLAPAQAATYAYRADTFAYDTPSGAAASVVWHTTTASPSCTSYPDGDDDWADVAFPAGFAFTFGGVSYSSVRVYSNGNLAFPPDVSGFHRDYTSQALPITAAPGAFAGCANAVPQKLMVAYWLDIVAGAANNTTGASVKYELLGTAPNRRFVISWVNVKLYNTTTRYNFQVVLQESLPGVNGNFKYQYTNGSSTGANAAVGVQLTTTDYTQYAFNQNFIDTTLGTTILWYPANQLAAKSAEYRFDEGSWSGAAGEVKDTSGSLQDATLASTNVTNVAGGKLCRGATFTNNTSNAIRDAIATPIVPASQGSVDFWFKSNSAWNAGGSDAMLLDATTVAARPFFLLKRANGALRFSVTDSAGTVITADTSTNYNYAASTWHHIAVSWSLKAGTNQTVLQIILDGVLASTSGTTPYRTTSSGAMASLSTLYIGDNRTSGITPTGGSPNGANGTIDEVYVYALDINATQAAADMALTRASCTTLNHFHIVHGGEVVNCGGAIANVTVEAHDASHALIALSGTTLAMSTSTNHGTWSSVSTINPVIGGAGNGVGSYTFANESSVTFGLANTFSESLNINLLSGAISESTGAASSCVAADYTYGSTCDTDLTFAQAGFLFDVPDHVAEVSQNVTVKAVKQSTSTAACVPLFANTSKALTFTCSYTNPTTGTLPVRVGGQALNTTNNATGQCDANGQAVTLAFDAAGVATPAVQYADVGKMTLNASYIAAGVTMTGTDTFIAAPKDFAFSAITASPIKAGSSFSATVTARNDIGAATPNFGKENTLPTPPEGATLSFAKYRPTGVGASNGIFSGSLGAFSGGVATASNLTWSEVGTMDLAATLTSSSYLGATPTLTVTGNTGNTGAVGRFIPHHFDTAVTAGCSAFTYSGQPFAVTVTAMNGLAVPTPTLNYDGSANTTPNFSKAVTLSEANAVAGALAPTSLLANAFTAGVASVSPSFTFTTSPSVPAAIKLRADDVDSVSSSSGTEGTTTIRSGRVRMRNAYGSELLGAGLPIPTIIEYYDGTAPVGWKQGADTCTNLTAANFAFATVAPSCATAVASCITALSVSATGTGPYKAPWTVKLAKPTAAGSMCIMLNLDGAAAGKQCIAPGAPVATATSAAAPWLRFGWTSATPTNPTSAATFGVYKSPLIYRRENY